MKLLFVPGGTLYQGNRMSPAMEARCRMALDLWRGGAYDRIILSGGVIGNYDAQTKPEADVMREWFVAHGVGHRNIYSENSSRDSYQNAFLSLEMLRRLGMGSAEITIVSQWEHALRMQMIFWFGHGVRTRRASVSDGFSLFDRLYGWAAILYTVFDSKGEAWYARQRRQHL